LGKGIKARGGKDNLYLTGLPGSDLDETGLKRIFSQLGCAIVRSRIFPDTRGTGHCAAMVQVVDQEQAEVAIKHLHGRGKISCAFAVDKRGSEIGPTPLVVKFAGTDESQSDNLYISGLPSPQVDLNSLKHIFALAGLTIVRSRTLADTRDKGFSAALVQVASPEEAAAAIDAFSGRMAAEIGLGADYSTPTAPHGGAPSHGNLFVGHLPDEVTESSLHEVFGCFGPITSVKITVDVQTGKSKGSGFVKFESPEDAGRAIEALNGQGGILVKYADFDVGKGKGKGNWNDDEFQQKPALMIPAKVVPAKFPGKGPPSKSRVPAGAAAIVAQQQVKREQMSLRYLSQDETPAKTIFMTGLPSPEGDAASLLQMFMSLGLKVGQIKMVPDLRSVGNSAAVVQFSSKDDGAAAMATLHRKRPADFGLTFEPLPVQRRQASESIKVWESAATPEFDIHFKGGPDAQMSDHVFISGLHWWVDREALQNMFSGLGMTVLWSKLYSDGGWSAGALVQLASEEDALLAVKALGRSS